jgi:hypothetical protein
MHQHHGFHRGTMPHHGNRPRKSANPAYNSDPTRFHSDNTTTPLRVLVPNEQPTFDPPAARALLRLLIAVRDARRAETADNDPHKELK